ncbi:MAG: heat-inducible transcription repressor HrcA [Anaerolineae bacterium]|nr:heat-inducible transcription repressor HrcA [Anaerolineae bacterium]
MSTDAVDPGELTERQKATLELIIRKHIEGGQPVSSKSLVGALRVSSATIRNDMGVLEVLGYIASPHTSAGRIPTEKGYRYFVQHSQGEEPLSSAERRMIAHQFHQAPLDMEQWMRLAAAILSRTARSASLVTAPYSKVNRFKHLELIATHGRLVLLVLVLHNGDVRQRMLTLTEPVDQERLSEIASRITRRNQNLAARQIRARKHDLDLLETEITGLILELMDEADRPQQVYRDGLTELLARFDENEGAEQALRILEEQTVLENLIEEAAPTVGSIRVVIAGEGRWENISLLSIVLSRYGVAGQATGTLGVLGPTRMSYGRAISAVRYMSDVMSNLMIGMYGEDDSSLAQ